MTKLCLFVSCVALIKQFHAYFTDRIITERTFTFPWFLLWCEASLMNDYFMYCDSVWALLCPLVVKLPSIYEISFFNCILCFFPYDSEIPVLTFTIIEGLAYNFYKWCKHLLMLKAIFNLLKTIEIKTFHRKSATHFGSRDLYNVHRLWCFLREIWDFFQSYS